MFTVFDYNKHDKICRTCLKTNDSMMSLFKTEILNMLSVCTTISISQGDGFPNEICSVCLQKVTDAYNFNKQCEHSDQILRKIQIDQSKPKFKYENCVSSEIKNYETEIIEEEATDKTSQWADSIELKPEDDDVKSEPYDEQIDNQDGEIDSNVDDVVEEEPNDNSNGDETKQDKNKRYKCSHCNTKPFDHIFKLRSHCERLHLDKTKTCTECQQNFVLEYDLKIHLRRRHKNVKRKYENSGQLPFSCPECGKQFQHRYKMNKHRWIHKEKTFSCTECDKKFKQKDWLNRHFQKCHTGERPREICKVCGKAVVCLVQHAIMHNDETFPCTKCSIEFTNKCALRAHVTRKHGKNMDATLYKPYLCNVCGIRVATITSLKSHMLSHTNERKYQCTVCTKQFKTLPILNTHVKFTHEQIKNAVCHICSKSFCSATVLKLHIRTHTGEKPFECQICNKAFSQTSSLRTHMKTHGLPINNVPATQPVEEIDTIVQDSC